MDGANTASAAAGAAATASGKRLYQSSPSDGVLHLVVIDLAGKNVIADGIIAQVSFAIKPGVATGNYSFTNIPSATDSKGNNLAITGTMLVGVGTNSTKAKVYLGTDDNFTVNDNGVTLYGGTGNDNVTINTGMSGEIIDQSVDRVSLSGASSNYAFKQTGNLINVYNSAGTMLILSMPVQDDTDGTLFSFSNGIASAKLAGGIMTLGGAAVNSNAPGVLTPVTTSSTQSTSSVTKAKVYLGTDDSFTVNNSGVTLYGGAGNDVVTVFPGMSGIILDQNIDRINLFGASSGYAFRQTGNKINVYDASGMTLLISVPVRDTADGTVLSFSNGKASAKLTASVMTLGGVAVNSSAASVLSPALQPAD